jgi:AraC-like DNA-binding protein
MSRIGPMIDPPPTPGAIYVSSGQLAKGQWFAWHQHSVHQLVWARSGVLSVRTPDRTWVLPPSLALLVPAGTQHTTGATAPSAMLSPFLRPRHWPTVWHEPTSVAVSALLAELIGYLAANDITDDARIRAERVVFDLLAPVEQAAIVLRMPTDRRAGAVADALLADPSDGRTLAEWGRTVGAGERTLARLFVEQTGLPFGRWRAQARLRAALPMLAEGATVAATASRIGYASPSAFVAAFRKAVGVTPATYFRTRR